MKSKIDNSSLIFHFLIKGKTIKFQSQYLQDLSVLGDGSPLGSVVGLCLFLFLSFIFSMAWIKLNEKREIIWQNCDVSVRQIALYDQHHWCPRENIDCKLGFWSSLFSVIDFAILKFHHDIITQPHITYAFVII